MDLYAEELKVWKECWIKWEGEESVAKGEKEMEFKEESIRMPGAFEW